jgi:hypothetical protein
MTAIAEMPRIARTYRRVFVIVVALGTVGLAFVAFFGVGVEPAAADCATTPGTPECVAIEGGNDIKDTVFLILVAVIPLAVGVYMGLRALGIVKKTVKV